MTCIQDPLHLYQVLLVYDVLVFLFINLDIYPVWQFAYVLVNMGMGGVAVMAAAFPDVSFLQNEYMGGFVGAVVVALFVMSHVASGWAAILSVGALMLLVGSGLQYTQDYASSVIDFHNALSTEEKIAVAIGLSVVLAVLLFVLYYCMSLGKVLMRCATYALIAWVAMRAMWIAGPIPNEYCCTSHSCAVWLESQDWLVVVSAFAWRLCSFGAFRWYRRDHDKLQLVKELNLKTQTLR